MNIWTALHKHTKRTSLCIRRIPRFEAVALESVLPLERSTEKHCPAEPVNHTKDHLVFDVHFNMEGSSVS